MKLAIVASVFVLAAIAAVVLVSNDNSLFSSNESNSKHSTKAPTHTPEPTQTPSGQTKAPSVAPSSDATSTPSPTMTPAPTTSGSLSVFNSWQKPLLNVIGGVSNVGGTGASYSVHSLANEMELSIVNKGDNYFFMLVADDIPRDYSEYTHIKVVMSFPGSTSTSSFKLICIDSAGKSSAISTSVGTFTGGESDTFIFPIAGFCDFTNFKGLILNNWKTDSVASGSTVQIGLKNVEFVSGATEYSILFPFKIFMNDLGGRTFTYGDNISLYIPGDAAAILTIGASGTTLSALSNDSLETNISAYALGFFEFIFYSEEEGLVFPIYLKNSENLDGHGTNIQNFKLISTSYTTYSNGLYTVKIPVADYVANGFDVTRFAGIQFGVFPTPSQGSYDITLLSAAFTLD